MATPGRPKFTQFRGPQLGRTLAQKLINPIDAVRDLSTRFGVRPYLVRLVKTRWSGGERGVGVENEIEELPLLPTPKVTTLDGLTEILQPVGLDENGLIQVLRISASYTEDQLLGRNPDGTELEPDVSFYWEIEYQHPDGIHGERRRCRPSGAPTYEAGKVQWTIKLEKVAQNRMRNGDPAP